jgi:hypothetical protein
VKRILTVLVVALVMAALLVVTAAPAFADCCNPGGVNKTPSGVKKPPGQSPP